MAQIKRIILLLEALDMSGPSFAALNIIPELLSSGCSLMVIARQGGEREDMFRAQGCDVRIFPNVGRTLFGRKAAESARKFEPGIIHAHSPDIAARALHLAGALKIPLVTTVNRLDNFSCLQPLLHSPRAWVIALSEAIQEKLINGMGFFRDRIRIIPNCLNLKFFPPVEENKHVVEGRLPVVGTYGTLTEHKGQRDFLQAAKGVLARGVDAEFLIMGHGPDKQTLRDLAEQLQISKRLTFSASTITDSRNISNIDIFVEPTRKEGFGMSVLQAMATGIPVIASGVGGIFSLIEDGVSGLLVSAGDTQGMIDGICRLLENPGLRQELAHNARARVEKEFSAKKIAARLLKFYNEIGG